MKKTITVNRQASFEYFIEEKFEAGKTLEGGEVKSFGKWNCTPQDSFCYLSGGEIFLKNIQITGYQKAGAF